jgi:hypothetical protein
VAYSQAKLPYASRSSYVFRRGLAMWLQMLSRLKPYDARLLRPSFVPAIAKAALSAMPRGAAAAASA